MPTQLWAAAVRPTAAILQVTLSDPFDCAELDLLESEWDCAIGAAEDAVVAASGMPGLTGRTRALAHERARTAALLDAVAHAHGIATWSSCLTVGRARSARAG